MTTHVIDGGAFVSAKRSRAGRQLGPHGLRKSFELRQKFRMLPAQFTDVLLNFFQAVERIGVVILGRHGLAPTLELMMSWLWWRLLRGISLTGHESVLQGV